MERGLPRGNPRSVESIILTIGEEPPGIATVIIRAVSLEKEGSNNMLRIAIVLFSIIVLASCSAQPSAESMQSSAPPTPEISSSIAEGQSVAAAAEPASEIKAPAVELGDAGVVADFKAPGNLKYAIGNIVQDEDSGQWAVLYAVSTYTGDKLWKFFEPEYATLHVQIFDENGMFIKHIPTELNPYSPPDGIYMNQIEPSDPCVFENGVLSFHSYSIYTRSGYMHGHHSNYTFLDTVTEAITVFPADTCAMDGDYAVLAHIADKLIFRMYDKKDLRLLSEISVPLDNMLHEGFYDWELSFGGMTAVCKNHKIIITVDFRTGTWKEERDYSELLNYPKLSNDKWEVYLADSGGAGDAFWADTVSLDKATGKILFLEYYNGCGYDFGPDDTLLKCDGYYESEDIWFFDRIQLISLKTGEVVKSLRMYENAEEDRIIRGVAYDGEKQLYLVAWSKYYSVNEFDERRGAAYDMAVAESARITLDIFDSDFNFLRSYDTGVDVHLYNKKYYFSYAQIELDGQGNATFERYDFNEPYPSIRYWE